MRAAIARTTAVEFDGRVGPGAYEVVALEMVDPESECAHVTGRWVMDAGLAP